LPKSRSKFGTAGAGVAGGGMLCAGAGCGAGFATITGAGAGRGEAGFFAALGFFTAAFRVFFRAACLSPFFFMRAGTACLVLDFFALDFFFRFFDFAMIVLPIGSIKN
jgi:hypothetical protein